MYYQIKNFYIDLINMQEKLNPIELAAWTHAEFVRIHPFRWKRKNITLNDELLLIANGFLPVNIRNENKLGYYNALEEYGVNRNLKSFSNMILELEEKRLDEVLEMIKEKENVLNRGQDFELEH